jgi:hypothetical protein
MRNFNLYKKRDGQDWKLIGDYSCLSFDDAKKEFARRCWDALLQGQHGDNFIELSAEDDGVEEDGIYYNNALFMAKSCLKDGIEYFYEDVYAWEIRDENLDYSLISNISFDGIDFDDYPDFCDAHIVSADYDGEPMTDEQLEILNDDRDFVFEKLWNHIH